MNIKNVILLKNRWKIGTPFRRWSWKKMARLLAHWHAKLKNWHAFGTLARKNEKLARFGHVDHAGRNGMHDTRFSKLNEVVHLWGKNIFVYIWKKQNILVTRNYLSIYPGQVNTNIKHNISRNIALKSIFVINFC